MDKKVYYCGKGMKILKVRRVGKVSWLKWLNLKVYRCLFWENIVFLVRVDDYRN